MAGKLIIAAAGSGKTQFIVDQAIAKANQGIRVLITTYTEACEQEIQERIVKECRYFPEQITVQSWWSFLISHCVKPFQASLFDFDVKGLLLVNGKSGLKYHTKTEQPVYYGESEFEKFYFTPDKKIYSDKLALLALRCDDKSGGRALDRISRCFNAVFIDEIQDFAGYDLEIIDRLLNRCNEVVLVGDPRQATYSTHSTTKHKQYKKADIVNFFEDNSVAIEIDDTSLIVNYRCCQPICDVSNALYPDMHAARSGNHEITGHDGVFAILPEKVDEYLSAYQPMQLRYSVSSAVNENHPVMNFGKSKGLTFERVLIYPTDPMLKWLKDSSHELKQAARSRFYVAITRARSSVAVILQQKDQNKISHLSKYTPSDINEGKTETQNWHIDARKVSQGFQGVATKKDSNGTVTSIYGHISGDAKEAISKTAELIESIDHRHV
jgi:DNA helicase-2/ATP-dependent DNA helicase PcrA